MPQSPPLPPLKVPMRRRRFLAHALWVLPVAGAAEGVWIEPSWLSVREIRVPGGPGHLRFAHFTDVHFKGDPEPLARVVDQINRIRPDFACFTGDLIERARDLPAAIEVLRGLRVPLYAVPGNHDLWCGARLEPLAECCRFTGGEWLADRQVGVAQVGVADGALELLGIERSPRRLRPRAGAFNLLLTHYPSWANRLQAHRYDLILAGHTHGGQVRLPFYGSLITPSHTDGYDLGHFDTPGGPLYVNPGIGTRGRFEFRFNCRPELTVFSV